MRLYSGQAMWDFVSTRVNSGSGTDHLAESWSATKRLLGGCAGAALAAYGAARRGVIPRLAGGLGLGLLLRSSTNVPLKRFLNLTRGRRGIIVHKTIQIAAPVEQVFKFWTRLENFPLFMTHVRKVRDLGDGRSHWVVSGPLGMTFEWIAVITRLVPNEVLAWRTITGFAVKQAGVIHFEAMGPSETLVDIKMSYKPPAGAVGDLVADLLGSDPKSQMDEDLARMRSFLERGKVPHDAAQPIPQAQAAVERSSAETCWGEYSGGL